MKCPYCNKAPYPYKDEQGNIIWKNLFRMDFMSIALLIIVLLLILGYKADMAKCDDAIKYPCTFCEKTNCCIGGIREDIKGGDTFETKFSPSLDYKRDAE
jgi:hypothetical protein